MRPSNTVALACALSVAVVVACGSSPAGPSAVDATDAGADGADSEPGRELLGGDTTVFNASGLAYSFPASNLSNALRDTFSFGDHMFARNWVTAPASTEGDDGLGPTFNATSCSACHLRDGRGAPPREPGEDFVGLLVRLSVPGSDEHGGPLGEPSYGGQLQPFSILGVPVEGKPRVTYSERAVTLAGGEVVSLRVPVYTFDALAHGPMAPGGMISPRVAPSMIGLGLLEAIPEADLRAMADPDDADGDGVSGRVNEVWDARAGRAAVGRFGWKANVPTIEQQVAGAFLGDIGITSSLVPRENCPDVQTACRAAKTGGEPELSDTKLAAVTLYSRTLAVPARRDVDDPEAQEGERTFVTLGCAACHKPRLVTGDFPGIEAISRQTIRPFTDLLLHDMGPDLADGRPDYLATGTEWRTPPLWGIGLLERVSKHTFLMHDGRARNVLEAIVWHGGEAQRSRDAFVASPESSRRAVLRFISTL